MRRFLIIVVAVFVALPLGAQETTDVPPDPVLDIRPGADFEADEVLWQNRLLVVFANSDRDPNFQVQLRLLGEHPEDLIARDVIVVTDTDPVNLSPLRERLRPRGFSLVFVDKDGQVKLRRPTPWAVREIVGSIDKTELRQQELRDR